MEKGLEIIQYVLGLGPTVILPIAIFFIGLFFRVKPGRAFQSAITVGIGFVGINLVIGLLSENLGVASQQMVERFGLELTVIDAGWPSAAAAAWASPVAAILIPIIIAVNLFLIFIKFTKTLDIDIWNFHHFMGVGAVGYIVTGNIFWAIFVAVLMEVIVLKVADMFAPTIQEFYGLPGISLPTGATVSYGLIGVPIGWLISKIPGIKNIEISPETIQKRFGVFGEPMIMGLIIGIVIGLLAGYDVGSAFQLGISLGAVMLLMPRMVKILMEGLLPISEGARTYLQTRYKDREIYLGLDAALAIGHPANISVGLILVPITLFLAVIIPGNKVLPFGDLATIPFYTAYITASRKGNIFHSVIAGAIVISLGLLMATNFAPVHTEMMQGLDQFTKLGSDISSLDTGGASLKWLILKLSQLVAPLFS